MLDANILLNFKGNLKFLFNLFEHVLIHEKVMEEVLDDTVKNEVYKNIANVTIVNDIKLEDDDSIKLFNKCDEELKRVFNINTNKDLGEYKTLLYAKFNKIILLSSQDTTVWKFILTSKYFKGLKCITIQDIAYLIYLNSIDKNQRKHAKYFYNTFGRKEHLFKEFKKYIDSNDIDVPCYIYFEANRIEEYHRIINEYLDHFNQDYEACQIEREIVNLAKMNKESCVSCLNSTIDKNNIDFNIRICKEGYNLADENCKRYSQFFDEIINTRFE